MSRTVVITGANRGIGLALCQHYVTQGEKVIAICRKSSEALDALPLKVIQNIDVADAKSVSYLEAEMQGIKIDILINNAGILRGMGFDSLDFEAIQRQFEVNTLGPIRVVKALFDNLSKGSKIGLITSRMGSIEDNTSGGSYGYRISKCGLNAAGKSMAVDFKPKGISVALLHPGYVNTEMVNYSGQVEPEQAAAGLVDRLEQLNLDNSGSFWHANGEKLPW